METVDDHLLFCTFQTSVNWYMMYGTTVGSFQSTRLMGGHCIQVHLFQKWKVRVPRGYFGQLSNLTLT